MTEGLQERCEFLSRNCTAISKKFVFENDLMSIVAGLLFTEAEKEVDVEQLKACRKILKNNTNVFSTFRKDVELVLLSKMALSEDPEKYIDDVRDVLKIINGGKHSESVQMILSSLLICDQGKKEQAEEIVGRYRELLGRMNKEHPFLTSTEDISFAMNLALTGRDIDAILADMEECSRYLRKECKVKIGANAAQGLSEMLAMTDGDVHEKCDRIVAIYKLFKEKKAGYGTGNAFSALGTLLDIDEENEVLVDEIIETEAILKKCKGFGEKAMDKEMRLMFATVFIAQLHTDGAVAAENNVISNTLETIRAKHIATTISIVAQVASSLAGALVPDKDEDEDKDKKEK